MALLSACSSVALVCSAALADQPGSGPLADSHAPAGVMYDHMHKAGEWMVGYRYMWSRMDGDTLNGTSKATDQEIMMNGCGDQVSVG